MFEICMRSKPTVSDNFPTIMDRFSPFGLDLHSPSQTIDDRRDANGARFYR